MLIRAASCALVVPGLSARCVFPRATGVVQLAGDGGAITLLRLPGVEVKTAPDTAEAGLPAAGQALPSDRVSNAHILPETDIAFASFTR